MRGFCFNHLTRERADLAAAMGMKGEVFLADEAGVDPKDKSRYAVLGRPVIYIE